MFGMKNPNANDLLQFWPNTDSHDDYVQKIFPLAEANKIKAAKRVDEKCMKNCTYKNVDRVKKKFQLGQIFAH